MYRVRKFLTYANVTATVAVVLALSGGAYALTLPANSVGSKQIINGQVASRDMAPSARTSLLRARGYARIRVIGIIGGGPYWNMALVGPHRGFISARTPDGGVTCLKPAATLSLSDVEAGVLQDASGNDTRLYFDGSFGCNSDEVRLVQKFNFDGSYTNQDFNIIVP